LVAIIGTDIIGVIFFWGMEGRGKKFTTNRGLGRGGRDDRDRRASGVGDRDKQRFMSEGGRSD